MKSNCTSSIVRSRSTGYEKEIECSSDKVSRSLVRVSPMDRVRNEAMPIRAGVKMELTSRVDQRVLRWFGHGENGRVPLAKGVLMGDVSVVRARFRPRLGWVDGVKVTWGGRGMTMEAARQIGRSGET